MEKTMRRSASEVIRNLESRIARLEGTKSASRKVPEILKRDLKNLGSSCKVVHHSKGMPLESQEVVDGSLTYTTTQMEGFIVKCHLNLLRKDVFVVFTRNLVLDEYDMQEYGSRDDKLVGVYNTLSEAKANFR